MGFLLCALAFGALIVRLRPGVDLGTPRIRLRLAALAMIGWSVVGWWITTRDNPLPSWVQLLPVGVMAVWVW